MSAIRDDDFNHRKPSSDLRNEVDQLRRQIVDLRQRLEDKPDNESKPEKVSEKAVDEPKPKEQATRRAQSWAREHPGKVVGLLILLAVLVVSGALLWHHMESFESTDDAEIDGHMDSISARISGTVLHINVEDNQTVAAGQTLVELDPTNYQVAADQARSDLVETQSQLEAENPSLPITETSNRNAAIAAQANVAGAQAALSAAQRSYDAAMSQLQQAEAVSVRASDDEVRYRNLVAKDEISKEFYDQKVTDARANEAAAKARAADADAAQRKIAESQAALERARSQLAETQANNPRRLMVNRATIATRTAAVQAAKARLDQALLNLTYCKILAPAAGVVGDKTVEAGQHIEAGQPLFMITQTNDIWVTANYKETQLRQMKAGQPVTVSVDAIDQNFKGYVESMPGATGAKYSLLPPENATGNYVKVVQRLPVRIRLNSGQPGMDRLRPGMSVETSVGIR